MTCVVTHLSVVWTTPQIVLLCRHWRGWKQFAQDMAWIIINSFQQSLIVFLHQLNKVWQIWRAVSCVSDTESRRSRSETMLGWHLECMASRKALLTKRLQALVDEKGGRPILNTCYNTRTLLCRKTGYFFVCATIMCSVYIFGPRCIVSVQSSSYSFPRTG